MYVRLQCIGGATPPYTMSTPPVLSSAMYDPTPPYTVHVAPQPMDMSSISLNLGAIQ